MRVSRAGETRRSLLSQLIYLLVIGAVIAALTHVATILALPYRSADDAYARVESLAGIGPGKTVEMPADLTPYTDPALPGATCLYDLSAGPAHVGLDVGDTDFALLAVYSRHGQVLYALTSRSATQGRLGLTMELAPNVLAPQILAPPAAAPATDPTGETRVRTHEQLGFVVAQVLALSPSAMPRARAAAATLTCR